MDMRSSATDPSSLILS